MNLDSEGTASFSVDFTFKARQERHHNNNLESISIAMCSFNPFCQAAHYQIFFSHEKLVLDVDEILGLSDEILIGIVDGVLF